MIWLLVGAICCVLVEVFRRLPLTETTHSMAALAGKSVAVISSRAISDHWKEKVLLAYSVAMLKRTVVLLGFILLLLGIVGAGILIGEMLELDVYAFLLSWQGILYSTLIAAAYATVRRTVHA